MAWLACVLAPHLSFLVSLTFSSSSSSPTLTFRTFLLLALVVGLKDVGVFGDRHDATGEGRVACGVGASGGRVGIG